MGGSFVLLVVLIAVAMGVTGHKTSTATRAAGVASDSPVVTFLIGMLPWPIIAGVIWLVAARSPVERRTLKWAVVFVMLIGAGAALSGALSATPKTSPAEGTS